MGSSQPSSSSIHSFKLHPPVGRMSNSGSLRGGVASRRWSAHVWAGQGARLGRRRKESGLRCSHRSLDPAGLSRVPPGLTSLFQTRLLRGLQGLRTSGPLSDPLAPELLTQQSFSMQAA